MKWLRNNGRWLFGNTDEMPATIREGETFTDRVLGRLKLFVDGAWQDVTGHTIKDSVRDTVSYVDIEHTTGSVPQAGFGTGIRVYDGNTLHIAGAVAWERVNPVLDSGYGQLVLYTQSVDQLCRVGTIVAANAPTEPGGTRGVGAVDIQPGSAILGSGDQTRIAAGDYSGLYGGVSNRAAGDESGVFVGAYNETNGAESVIAGGNHNETNAIGSVINGGENNTTDADARFSVVLGGRNTNATVRGEVVAGEGGYKNRLSMRLRRQVAHVATDWYDLTLDGTANTFIPLATGDLMTARVLVTGGTASLSKKFSFEIVALIANVGGTTSIVTQTVTPIYRDDTNFSCQLAVNGNELLAQVRDTGVSGDTVLWHAVFYTSEV